jgi:hypothetical protein
VLEITGFASRLDMENEREGNKDRPGVWLLPQGSPV